MTEADLRHLADTSAPISDDERVQAAAEIRHLRALHAPALDWPVVYLLVSMGLISIAKMTDGNGKSAETISRWGRWAQAIAPFQPSSSDSAETIRMIDSVLDALSARAALASRSQSVSE